MFVTLTVFFIIGILLGFVVLIKNLLAGLIVIVGCVFWIALFWKLWNMEQAIIELQKQKKDETKKDGE